MPLITKRPEGNLAPTVVLWIYALAVGIAGALTADSEPSAGAEYVSRIAFSLIVAAWVQADSRKLRQRHCYDFDSFVFFAWPIIVPVYLFRTRGVRAFLTLLWFAGIWLVAMLAAAVVMLVRGIRI